jgi:hypothetical protein
VSELRVRNVFTNIVCDKTEDELAVLPDMYEVVDDNTPITQAKCCGEDDTIEYDDIVSHKEEY